MVNRVSSLATRSAAYAIMLSLLELADSRRPNLLRVLTYHRVDEPEANPALYPGLISATPDAFDQQMSYLAANYHVVSIQEVLDACRTGVALPPRSVLVTFDDAYCDFAVHAWPIMKRYRLPATLFVATAFPDHPERTFWWDRLYHAFSTTGRRDELVVASRRFPLETAAQRSQACARLMSYVKTLPHQAAMTLVDQICDELGSQQFEPSILGWEALRQLVREGVMLGAHTRTHPLLNRVSLEEVQAEAVGSLRDLEREVGVVPPIFAYPSGAFNSEVVRVLERERFVLAFTTVRGINDLSTADRLRLRRINVGRRVTLGLFRTRLLPWSLYLNRWRPLSGTP